LSQSALSHETSGDWPPGTHAEGPGRSSRTWGGYGLSFAHFQLVMLRRQRGAPYGIPLDSLGATQLQTHDRVKKLLSVEAKVFNNGFHLRVQQIQLFAPAELAVTQTPGFDICGHLSVFHGHARVAVGWLMGQYQRQGRLDGYQSKSGPKCRTAFEVGLADAGAGHVALVISKWMNVGQGKSKRAAAWWLHHTTRTARAWADYDTYYQSMTFDSSTSDKPVRALTEGNLAVLREVFEGTVALRFGWMRVGGQWAWRRV
jgi:hypothetical protein